MNTLMPAPVAKPQIGEQAVAARLRAGTHFSSSRVHACESSLAGLPGLYSGSFYSARSVRKAGMPPPVETRVCIKCGEEKPITTFRSNGKCGACRYQEQLMRNRHGGAYSRAGTK